jgi:Flp pilus assembly protein TadD
MTTVALTERTAEYAPSMRWRLIRLGLPILLLLLAITAYMLINAETFTRNADPDSISIPVFLLLVWVSIPALAFVPLFLIGGTRLIVAPQGFAFGGRLKGAYLKVEGGWGDIAAAGYAEGRMATDGVITTHNIFGLIVRQGSQEQFISLHHFRDQLGENGPLGAHLRTVAPHVYAGIQQALRTKETIAISPSASAAAGEEAARAMAAGDYAAAVEGFQQAVRQSPRDHRSYFYLAQCLGALGRTEEAVQALQQGLTVRPTSSALAYNLGLMTRRAGREDEAQTHFRRALTLIADDADLADKQDFARLVREALD